MEHGGQCLCSLGLLLPVPLAEGERWLRESWPQPFLRAVAREDGASLTWLQENNPH